MERGETGNKTYTDLNVRVTPKTKDFWSKLYHEWKAEHPDRSENQDVFMTEVLQKYSQRDRSAFA